jgi:hypothetical protein
VDSLPGGRDVIIGIRGHRECCSLAQIIRSTR